tara:strand:+ start:417 stop:1019 length:603 start_codon:yes stop_codon:yes gene_type:complete
MSRCFGSSSKLSAKDYTNKRANYNMFCDLRQKFISSGFTAVGTTNACLNKSGIISKFNSQNDQLNIKKGFEEYLSVARKDLSQNYIGQQIKSHFCSPYDTPQYNIDISNNYTPNSTILTLANAGDTGQTIIIDSSGSYVNRYAEIKGVSAPTTTLFPNGKKIIYQNCGTDLPIRASGRMQIVIASELPPPIISALEIIIV